MRDSNLTTESEGMRGRKDGVYSTVVDEIARGMDGKATKEKRTRLKGERRCMGREKS